MRMGLKMRKTFALACCLSFAALFAGCSAAGGSSAGAQAGAARAATPQTLKQVGAAPRVSSGSAFLDKLSDAAVERTGHEVRYDPTYFKIDYPGGDVPAEVGVCTDEVIRSYRAVGVDLQKLVHEDMADNFSLYPHTWGLKKPDTNIDHRRVPNLMVFFARQGAGLPLTQEARDYRPGDVVTWDLGGGLTHIGVVVGVPSAADEGRLQIVHNIGAGPKMEDVLFAWKITGHYRYQGPKEEPKPAAGRNANTAGGDSDGAGRESNANGAARTQRRRGQQ
jgi:uncharacterized protein YijF (DUF1287 family)